MCGLLGIQNRVVNKIILYNLGKNQKRLSKYLIYGSNKVGIDDDMKWEDECTEKIPASLSKDRLVLFLEWETHLFLNITHTQMI